MKIYILIAGFSQGGAQRQCAWIANAMAEDPDINLRLLYFIGGENINLLDSEKVETTHLHTKSLYSLGNVVRVLRLLRERKPDVIFTWLHAADVIMGLARPFLPNDVQWVIAERDSAYPSNWRYALRRYLGMRADAVIANSVEGKNYWLANGYDENKAFVVDNILSPEVSIAEPSVSRFDFLYAGRLEPQKNVEVLAEAFVRLAIKRPNLNFGIIGDGSLSNRISKIIEEGGVTRRVILQPYNPQIAKIFKAGPIFVSLSHHEGLPNTILENVACGNRIVASRIPGHIDILGANYPLLVANFDDPSAVVDALELALNFDGNSKIMAHGLNRIKSMNRKNIMNHYKKIFYSLQG